MTEYKCKWNKAGNIKVGNMWTFSMLMGGREIFIDKLGFSVLGTCGGHCDACENKCYVKKSYRYPSVKYGHAVNTLAMRQDPIKAAKDLSGYIARAKNKPAVCRYDQSGEIENDSILDAFISIANDHKDVQFFVYTKAYNIVIPALLSGRVPENLTVLISVWHEYGLAAFNMVKHLANVKAFVYDDNDFDYAAVGLKISTWCRAYDEKGKLDKNITCQKCTKCFNRLKSCKVIGCKAH